MAPQNYIKSITDHYTIVFSKVPMVFQWDKGPTDKLFADFRVLEFPPVSPNGMWAYCTVGMSSISEPNPIELHILSNCRDHSLVELLTIVAYFHKNSSKLGLWHTLNFGRAWQENSSCDHGYISLPYIYGPDLENCNIQHPQNQCVKCYWLIPVTKPEVEYKKLHGVESLEQLFEENSINYLNPERHSLV